ncbi:MAG TPA: hypothetical protein VG328_01630 [Stellaceae bacterium]|nr:hypothetical protein [Stellaceae bacterium]
MTRTDTCRIACGLKRRIKIYVPANLGKRERCRYASGVTSYLRGKFLTATTRDESHSAWMINAISAHNSKLATTMKTSVLRPLQRSDR